MLRIRIRDPVPFLHIDPGWVKIKIRNPESSSRIIFLRGPSYNFSGYKYLNYLMRIRIRNLLDPGAGIRDGKIRIRAKYHGSTTLNIKNDFFPFEFRVIFFTSSYSGSH